MRIALIAPGRGVEGNESLRDYAFHSKFLLSRKYVSCLLAIPTLAALTPAIRERLRHYWRIDFWKEHNTLDPVKLKYRLLFAARLCIVLASRNTERSKFITAMLRRAFDTRVRVSSILALMAYNDFAYSFETCESTYETTKIENRDPGLSGIQYLLPDR